MAVLGNACDHSSLSIGLIKIISFYEYIAIYMIKLSVENES